MKICEFCGTANNDDAVKCSSCGSNSFKHKCNNCGTEFNEGNFCPKCGVSGTTDSAEAQNMVVGTRLDLHLPSSPYADFDKEAEHE